MYIVNTKFKFDLHLKKVCEALKLNLRQINAFERAQCIPNKFGIEM
jgi:hypothetical protein